MGRSFHLWRTYATEPFDRFACTVEHDPQADDGYHIVDFDPSVADAGFLHAFADHMSQPAPAQDSTYEDGGIREQIDWLKPGTEKHFCEAIRMFPLATVSGKGRP